MRKLLYMYDRGESGKDLWDVKFFGDDGKIENKNEKCLQGAEQTKSMLKKISLLTHVNIYSLKTSHI